MEPKVFPITLIIQEFVENGQIDVGFVELEELYRSYMKLPGESAFLDGMHYSAWCSGYWLFLSWPGYSIWILSNA